MSNITTDHAITYTNTTLSFWILLTRLLIYFGECIIHLYLAEPVNMARDFSLKRTAMGVMQIGKMNALKSVFFLHC